MRYLKCYKVVNSLEFVRDNYLLVYPNFLENILKLINLFLNVLLYTLTSLIQKFLICKRPENFSTLNWYLYVSKLQKNHNTNQDIKFKK